MRIEYAELAGRGGSDDRTFLTPNAVIMLDGASAFVPVPVPAAQYAEVLGQHIRDALLSDPEGDLTEIVRAAIAATRAQLGLTPGESPSSTVAIARAARSSLDLFVLGDTEIIMPSEVLRDNRMDELDIPARRKYRQRLANGSGYDQEHRALLRELQTEQARRRNQPDGYWIAEADPSAADHAVQASRALSEVPWVVLATDGAYETMRHLQLDRWTEIAASSGDDLAALLARCQEWEAMEDPDGRQHPRSKRHDDKSLAVMRFSDESAASTK